MLTARRDPRRLWTRSNTIKTSCPTSFTILYDPTFTIRLPLILYDPNQSTGQFGIIIFLELPYIGYLSRPAGHTDLEQTLNNLGRA